MRLAVGPASMPRSGIREIMELAAGRPDVVHLEVGEPDFETPSHIVEAAVRAIRSGQTRYSPNTGIADLREALAEKVSVTNRFTVTPSNIIVSNGAVEGLFSALAATLEPGDEVLVPDPGWPNYRMMISILNACAIGYELDASRQYLPVIEQLESLTTIRTRVLIVNTPSNPLGVVLPIDTIRELTAFAERHDLWIVSDECYDQLVLTGESASVAAVGDPERVISVFSFSKTYAMTGWRVGYIAAPDSIRDTIVKIQEPVISCVNTPAQYAALAALTGPQDIVAEMTAAYRVRRDLVQQILVEGEIDAPPPAGAFYQWLPIDAESTETTRGLVISHGVAVAPGSTFGKSGRRAVRISLATSRSELTEGLSRLLGSGLAFSSIPRAG